MRYGFPLSRASRRASSSACFSIRSASLFISLPRSAAAILRHGPRSNAWRAAFTARSTSSLSASATRQISSPVEGLIVAKVRPEAASVHRLLIKSLFAVIGMVLSGACAVVDMENSSLPAPRSFGDTALVYTPLRSNSRPRTLIVRLTTMGELIQPEEHSMRRCVLSLLVFCCMLPAQTKKVIANLSPDMVKELAVSAPNVKIVSARGPELAKEIEDADAMVGVTLTPELFKHARQLKWLHISSAGVESHGRQVGLFPELVAVSYTHLR